jgi:transposase-like protein
MENRNVFIWWNNQRQRAAQMFADGTMSSAEIAVKLGVSLRTLATWKRHPGFGNRVVELTQAYADELHSEGVASKQFRLNELNEAYQKLRFIMTERSADPGMMTVPGGTTGLLVRRERMIGTGRNARRIVEWEIDKALIRAMLTTMKQAAREMGEWDASPVRTVDESQAMPSNVIILPREDSGV